MAVNKRRPLQPIFDEKKQMGAVDTGNSPTLAVEYCDDFDPPDGSLGPNWRQQLAGGISKVGGSMYRNGRSKWAQFLPTISSSNMYVEYEDENVAAHLALGGLRIIVDDGPPELITAYWGGYYPAYSSHPNGEWLIMWDRDTPADTWVPDHVLASASTPDPVGPITVRFEAITDISDNVVLNLYEVILGVPTLRLTYTHTSPTRILTGSRAGLSPGLDPIHTSSPTLIDNFCCGTI